MAHTADRERQSVMVNRTDPGPGPANEDRRPRALDVDRLGGLERLGLPVMGPAPYLSGVDVRDIVRTTRTAVRQWEWDTASLNGTVAVRPGALTIFKSDTGGRSTVGDWR